MLLRPLGALAPCGREVRRHSARTHGGGAEALVLPRLSPEALGQGPGDRDGVPLNRDVQVDGLRAPQHVADRSADQIRGRQPPQRGEQLGHARQLPDPLREVQGLTGMPAPAIRSLASWTVYVP